jgi:O-acetyl-ADP-ribose deacetylase (regulator of RNase III)
MMTFFLRDSRKPKAFRPELFFKARKHHASKVAIKSSSIQRWTQLLCFPNNPERCVSAGVSTIVRNEFNDKISLWQGDVTLLQIDAIVNAANETLRAGGGICGAIHKAAGPDLEKECFTLEGCETGQTKITDAYRLPCKKVLHTVGPIGEQPELLSSCYRTVLDLAVANELRSICFCCISTGIFGYPNEQAAEIALTTVRQW